MAEQQVDSSTPPPAKKKRHGCLKGCLFGCLGLFLLVAVLFVVGLANNDDWHSDAYILKKYPPTAEIAEIALKNTFTDKGKSMLYRTKPQFVLGEEFRKICVSDGVEGLACTDGRKTTFLQIDDPEFDDHKFSAAAHEMMHVAYKILKTDDQARVDAMLEQELKKHQDDTHLTGILDILKEKKVGDADTVKSELHSKFAVEYIDLSPELEEYYRRYFTDRQQAVKLYRNGGFNSRVRRLDQLSQENVALEAKINVLDKKLRTLRNAPDLDVDSFNAQVNQINGLIKQYNAKVAESQKVYAEVERFYRYFNPDFKAPEPKAEQ